MELDAFENSTRAKVLDDLQFGSHLRVNKTLIRKIGLQLAALLANYINIYTYMLEYNPAFTGIIKTTLYNAKKNTGLSMEEITEGTNKLDKMGLISWHWERKKLCIKFDFEAIENLLDE